jgi:hypothetical protein
LCESLVSILQMGCVGQQLLFLLWLYIQVCFMLLGSSEFGLGCRSAGQVLVAGWVIGLRLLVGQQVVIGMLRPRRRRLGVLVKRCGAVDLVDCPCQLVETAVRW